ncbi:hypothetical protein M569_16182, partial [Genlisea aurea]
AWPVAGHLHIMAGKKPHVALASMADKHGPVFSIKLGSRHVVVVSDHELAKELFTAHDGSISSRPKLRALKHLTYDFAMFGFAPYGSFWRGMRKLVVVELLSSKRIEMMSHVRESEITEAMDRVFGNDGVLVDMKKWFGDLTFKIMLRMMAGDRFCHGGAGEMEIPKLHKLLKEYVRLMGVFVPADAWPFLRWFDLGGQEKIMKKTAAEMDGILTWWLTEARKHSGDNSFIDVLLSVLPTAELRSELDTDTIIKATIEGLITAGTQTTSMMLTWILTLILNHPTVLNKIQEELDQKIGRNRRPIESDVNDLVYLKAVVKETFRLYPISPLGIPRQVSEDFVLRGGHRIPKGSWVALNLWRLQRDAAVWSDDASEFRPERFLEEKRNVDVRGREFELMPFGAGRRSCPGMNLGLSTVHCVLANLLHGLDVTAADGRPVDTDGEGISIYSKVRPLHVFLKPRLN